MFPDCVVHPCIMHAKGWLAVAACRKGGGGDGDSTAAVGRSVGRSVGDVDCSLADENTYTMIMMTMQTARKHLLQLHEGKNDALNALNADYYIYLTTGFKSTSTATKIMIVFVRYLFAK